MNETTTNQKTPQRAVVYARVSTKAVADRGTCLEEQFADIERYANDNGIEIVKQFYDIGRSARKSKRPGLQQLLEFATDDCHKIDFVITQSLSRLSRDSLSYFADIRNRLKPAGVSVRSATEHVDESPQGQLNEMMLIGQAQWYSSIRKENR